MAEIVPFKALHYDIDKTVLNEVIAPPYDQISDDMQREFYRRNPYNFVRLTYGKIEPGDTPLDNRYTRASAFLKQWMNEGILVQEQTPSLFVVEQTFFLHEKKLTRTGVVGFVRLEPLGTGILPHEQTFPKPKEDRLKLMRACRTDFEQVFFLVDDSENRLEAMLKQVQRIDPALQATDEFGTQHLIRRIPKNLTPSIQVFFQKKQLLIADGHHRYETSLEYDAESGTHFRLATTVRLQDPGLVILPTQRLLKSLSAEEAQALKQKLPEYFTQKEVVSLDEILRQMNDEKHGFGWVENKHFRLLSLKDSFNISKKFPTTPKALRELDVFLLHQLIFDRILKLPHETLDERIQYIRWPKDVMHVLESNSESNAFFLNPVKPADVNAVAQAGLKMPHKSTDFYPKLWSGLLF